MQGLLKMFLSNNKFGGEYTVQVKEQSYEWQSALPVNWW
jgi:hypothetical protein